MMIRNHRKSNAATGRVWCIRAVLVAAVVCGLALGVACQQDSKAGTEAQAAARAMPPNPADFDPPADAAPAGKVDAARAMNYVKEFVAIGPKPPNSEGHKKAEDYLRSKLQSLAPQVEEDAFTANTPEGQMPMRNFIAKFPGKKDGVIVLAGHYDTNYPLRDRNYVGANDSGSSTGLLLELAEQFKSRPPAGYSVWIVLLDGEEAVQHWTPTDSLYGSRHLAQRWKADGTAKNIKALIVLDMVGDKTLGIERDYNSAPWLQDVVFRAATRLGSQSYFYAREIGVEDDHRPFAEVGIPVADLIDFEYGFNNIFHHTTQDTLDKLSPQSLQIVGDVVLETIRALNTK